jgi:hypothetical protein
MAHPPAAGQAGRYMRSLAKEGLLMSVKTPLVWLLLSVVTVAACRDTRTPVTPTAIAAQTPASRPTGSPTVTTGPFKVSIAVSELTSLRPMEGVAIYALIQEQSGFGYSYEWLHGGPLRTDVNGRFELLNLPQGVTVLLVVSKAGYVQQCAAPVVTVYGDTTVNAQLVPTAAVSGSLASLPPAAVGFRHISGVIYTNPPEGKRPVAGAFVEYMPVMDIPAARTFSDPDGRYVLCGIGAQETALIGASYSAEAFDSGRGIAWGSVPPGLSDAADIVLP